TNGFAQRGAPPRKVLLDWIDRLAAAQLTSTDPKMIQPGLELVRDLKIGSAFADCSRLAKADSKFAELRPIALDAASAANPEASIDVLRLVLENAKEPVEIRRKAAENLALLSNLAAARKLQAALLPISSQDLAGVIARGMSRNKESGLELAKLFDERKASVLL